MVENTCMPGTPNSEKLMVVEDDPLNRKVIAKILTDAGYQVHTMQNGQQCLDQVVQVAPQLILMDINMPGLDGIQTCHWLKRSQTVGDLPIIFVTGSYDEQTLEAAFAAGGCDFVRKPVSRIELLARVRSALNQRQAARKMAEDEKLKGVLETAGGVCHELNQPLQYILGVVQILLFDLTKESPLYRHLDDVRIRIEQMGEITHKLSSITRYRTREYAGGHMIIDIRESISGSEHARPDTAPISTKDNEPC